MDIKDMIATLDEFYKKEDVEGAGAFLENALEKARAAGDEGLQITLLSELMGFYRRNQNAQKAEEVCVLGIELLEKTNSPDSVAKAAVWINAATTLCSCRKNEKDILLFQKARDIYQRLLRQNDPLWASFYNNYATALEVVGELDGAEENYLLAVEVAGRTRELCSLAVSYVNLARVASAKNDDKQCEKYIELAFESLEKERERGEKYAFACRKCAEQMDALGYFYYAARLNERADRIYERA